MMFSESKFYEENWWCVKCNLFNNTPCAGLYALYNSTDSESEAIKDRIADNLGRCVHENRAAIFEGGRIDRIFAEHEERTAREAEKAGKTVADPDAHIEDEANLSLSSPQTAGGGESDVSEPSASRAAEATE